MSRYKIITAPYLDEMLLTHIAFIARVSIPAARKYREEFAEIVRRLAENPYQFPVCEDANLQPGQYRKALFAKWYQAIFYVGGDTVYLDAVIDGRSDKN